jgi:hypothetical protein
MDKMAGENKMGRLIFMDGREDTGMLLALR